MKLAATRGYGAEVVLYDRVEQKREVIARQLGEERGLTLIPPFEHPHIIAGQGTAALELLTDVPDLDVLIVPIGGGGLISGCSIAAHALKPDMRIFGVEPDTANDTFLSLQKGAIVSTPQSHSIMDGLLPTAPGELTFSIMREHLESVALVTDDEAADGGALLVAADEAAGRAERRCAHRRAHGGQDSERAGQEDRRGVVRRKHGCGEVGGNADE